MKALAEITASKGHLVSGSDIRLSGHDKRNIEGCDLVVFSGAIGEDNEELSFSRRYGIPVMERSEYLARLSMDYKRVIAVSGCHGKTTTTAMLGEVFASKNPTLHVGGDCGLKTVGKHEYFITEACEYRRSFLRLSPSVGVVTNIEFDHPDTYADEQEVVEAFKKFGQSCRTLIYNGDDRNCRRAFGGDGITFGFGDDNMFVAKPWGENKFDVFYCDLYMGTYTLSALGRHNIYNALGAIATGFTEGMGYREIEQGISRFKGVKRRGEVIGRVGACDVISDYAHHPTEITASISALKCKYGKVAVIFQPHTYTRTLAMPEQFMLSFENADFLAITNTFGAREREGDDRFLCKVVEKVRQCEFVAKEKINEKINLLARDYDCVALLGAGDFQESVKLQER